MSDDKSESSPDGDAVPGDVWQQIGKLAQNITEDTDTLREKAITIAQKIAEVAAVAGFYYGDSNEENWWEYNPDEYPEIYTSRIAIWKGDDSWECGVEETTNWPKKWDGSNWVGWDNPFEKCSRGSAKLISRKDLAQFVKRLPQFLENYLDFLKGRHTKYSHVKILSEALSKVLV